MTEGISNNLKSTLAYQIAAKLDAQDGADGQISKSIWDGFVADKGGRQIEESISLKEAINFIATNLVRQAKTAGKTVDELAKEWLGKVNSSETPASGETKKSGGTEQADGAATTPPVKAPISEVPPPKTFPPAVNIPENDPNPPQMSDLKMDGKSNSVVKEKDGTTYFYYGYGGLKSINNHKGQQIQRFVYDADGSIRLYSRLEYNAIGDNTRTVSYTPDGVVSHYHDQIYNNDHLVTSEIWRLSDGSVYGHGCTRTYEYNADGKETRRIYYNSDGSVDNYLDTEYDANGNKTRTVYRDANGNVKEYTVYKYGKGGYYTATDYNPDGTKRE